MSPPPPSTERNVLNVLGRRSRRVSRARALKNHCVSSKALLRQPGGFDFKHASHSAVQATDGTNLDPRSLPRYSVGDVGGERGDRASGSDRLRKAMEHGDSGAYLDPAIVAVDGEWVLTTGPTDWKRAICGEAAFLAASLAIVAIDLGPKHPVQTGVRADSRWSRTALTGPRTRR